MAVFGVCFGLPVGYEAVCADCTQDNAEERESDRLGQSASNIGVNLKAGHLEALADAAEIPVTIVGAEKFAGIPTLRSRPSHIVSRITAGRVPFLKLVP